MSKQEKPKKSKDSDLQKELQEKIVEDYPRLSLDDTFTFSCHPGISCFNKCCSDVNIFLSPYDVLRMKKRLGITSGEFLDKYTLLPVQKDMKTPVVMLKMNDDEEKTCQFLTEGGCGIYTDRPWPCRMYPLGLATSKDTPDGWRGERFYFLMQEMGCKGFEEQHKWTVREWIDNQGIDEYDEWGEAFKELTLHPFFETGGELSPEKIHMLFTSCYDLDKFRRFVFNSTLLQRFEIDEDFVEEMKYSEETLLRFAFLWLRFSLFGETTVKMNKEAIAMIKGQRAKKKLADMESAAKDSEEEK